MERDLRNELGELYSNKIKNTIREFIRPGSAVEEK